MLGKLNDALESGKKAGSLSAADQKQTQKLMQLLADVKTAVRGAQRGDEAFKIAKADFDARVKALKKSAEKAGKKLSHLFLFAEDAFPDGQEMLILVTELTISRYGARFISRYGCKEYFAHNKELLFYERRKEIRNEIQTLELE